MLSTTHIFYILILIISVLALTWFFQKKQQTDISNIFHNVYQFLSAIISGLKRLASSVTSQHCVRDFWILVDIRKICTTNQYWKKLPKYMLSIFKIWKGLFQERKLKLLIKLFYEKMLMFISYYMKLIKYITIARFIKNAVLHYKAYEKSIMGT